MAAFLNNTLVFFFKCSLFTLVVVRVASDSNSKPCPFDHYFDITNGQCEQCSSCPTDHITIKPCSKNADVKCRPFILKNLQSTKTDNSDFKFNSDLKSTSKSKTALKERILESLNIGSSNDENSKKSPSTVNSELSNGEDSYWKTLAFALIGLLSVLIITTFIILIFVYKKLQKSIVITQTEDADLMDDADSGYVVIRAIHHMATPRADNQPILSLYPRDQMIDSHISPPPPPLLTSSGPTSVDSGRPTDSLSMSTPISADDNDDSKSCFLPKTYQPQRRLLNYDADDVFESDDNASINHHQHHSADPKQKLQTLIDESESNT